jgi:6-phosphogluconolactonase
MDERIAGAEEIPGLVAADLAQAAAATIAVPGGSVAVSCFPRLAELSFAGRVYQVDERAVPPQHPDSNARLLRERWPDAHLVRLYGEWLDLEAAAWAYEVQLPRQLDWVLLGVGADGHVASLFPGHALLSDTSRRVAAIYDSVKPPARRLTLTLPALLGARRVVVVAFGAEKAAILAEARRDSASELPVARILHWSANVLLLMDPAAAG